MRLARNRTTLFIAHRMGTLIDVSRRLYFEGGHVLGDGAHSHLMDTVPGYAKLVNSGTAAT